MGRKSQKNNAGKEILLNGGSVVMSTTGIEVITLEAVLAKCLEKSNIIRPSGEIFKGFGSTMVATSGLVLGWTNNPGYITVEDSQVALDNKFRAAACVTAEQDDWALLCEVGHLDSFGWNEVDLLSLLRTNASAIFAAQGITTVEEKKGEVVMNNNTTVENNNVNGGNVTMENNAMKDKLAALMNTNHTAPTTGGTAPATTAPQAPTTTETGFVADAAPAAVAWASPLGDTDLRAAAVAAGIIAPSVEDPNFGKPWYLRHGEENAWTPYKDSKGNTITVDLTHVTSESNNPMIGLVQVTNPADGTGTDALTMHFAPQWLTDRHNWTLTQFGRPVELYVKLHTPMNPTGYTIPLVYGVDDKRKLQVRLLTVTSRETYKDKEQQDRTRTTLNYGLNWTQLAQVYSMAHDRVERYIALLKDQQ